MQVFAAVIDGPRAATAMKDNTTANKNQSVRHLWGLEKITPGAIAGSAVLVRCSFYYDDFPLSNDILEIL